MPRIRKAERTLSFDDRLRLAVIADTHSAPHPRSLDLVAAEKPDAILHAGDIGDVAVLERFGAIAPLIAVRGNIDAADGELPDEVTVHVEHAGETLFRLLLLHIAVAGPKLRADALRKAQAAEASLVVCGHSHVPFLGRDRGVSVFNPGSIGPRRFHLPIVFGVVDVAPARVDLKHVDCETGARWMP